MSARAPRKRGEGKGLGGRLDAYILEEILPLMLASLVVVILLFVLYALYEVLAPILAKGANPLLVARLMAFSLPEAFGRALPLAMLFAVLLGFSRLSSDAEIKSILAGGIAPLRLAVPIMTLSVLVALLSFVNNELLLPRASSQAQQTQRDIVLDNPRVLVQEKAVFTDNLNRAIYVDKVLSSSRLEGIQIVQMAPGEAPREVISAGVGQLERGSATIVLFNGERVTYSGARVVSIQSFKQIRLAVRDLQASLGGRNTGAGQAMRTPTPQLLEQIRQNKANGWNTADLETALNRKFAEPLAAVAFGFFGVMLALFTFRAGAGVGLVWTLLLTFAYYATWSVFRVMGEQGALPPVIAAWTPDLLYVLGGGVLWALSSRR